MDTASFITPDFGSNPIVFLQEVKTELIKVVWPNRQSVFKMTVLIVVVSLVVGAFLGILDYEFTKLFSLFLK